MIRIAVCDDEEAMRADLASRLAGYFESTGIPFASAFFPGGEALLKSGVNYDAVFLDIQMDGLTGMETARRMRAAGYGGFLVFVTVLNEYVFDAFEVEAADYLVKPIDDARFCRVMGRISGAQQNGQKQRLFIPLNGGGCRILPFCDILYCEADNHRIFLHTLCGTVSARLRIRALEGELGDQFFRCHRSYLVNLKHVRGYDGGMALLSGGQRLPVSRLREQAFTEAVLRCMKKGAQG